MLKEIKYNRSYGKLINILRECTKRTNVNRGIDFYYINDFEVSQITYYVQHKSKVISIYYSNFEFNDITFGLSKRDIFNIINDKFNENDYKIVIKDDKTN